jgi:epsilon-lactone hydrolase
MPSFRSKVVIGMIRNRHLMQGKLKPEIVDETFSVEEFRRSVDKQSARAKMPAGVTVTPVTVDEMYAEWITPEGAPQEKVILYIHGGGFMSGSCLTHRMHVAKFALGTGVKALLFDYRLAPEHPYPAAVDDCLAAYRWLLVQGYAPADIVIAGESAGGTLTLATLVALRDLALPLPSGGVSISPVTDLTCSAPSFLGNFKTDIAPFNSWNIWTQYYIADNDPALPWLSPLMADLTGLPPMLLCIGTGEIHYDDTVNFAAKAKRQGNDVTLLEYEGMCHAFPILAPLFPEATDAMAKICAFMRQRLAESAPVSVPAPARVP